MFFKLLRLTFLALCIFLSLTQISCTNSAQTQPLTVQKEVQILENAVNINTATVEELEKLPRIGTGIAKKIIEFREKNGKFRRAEHLILVRGMSDKKFRELQNLVKVE